MTHDWLHHYGHLTLYLIGIGGSIFLLGVVLLLGRHYRPSKKERARRRAKEAREQIFSRKNQLAPREALRGELPPSRSQDRRPKTMPFAPGGSNPLKTPKADIIVPFSPSAQEQESKAVIRTPIEPTPPDIKQGGS